MINKIFYYIALVFTGFTGLAFAALFSSMLKGNASFILVALTGVLLAGFVLSIIGLRRKIRAGKQQPPSEQKFNPATGEVYEQPVQQSDAYLDRWEDGLLVLWQGSEDIAFTYEANSRKKSRRNVTLSRVLGSPDNGCFYFRGFCHLRNEDRTFDVLSGVKSTIAHKRKQYEWADFFVHVLGLDMEKVDAAMARSQS